MSKTRETPFFSVWVRQRELGLRLPLGRSDVVYKSLYSSLSRCHSWSGGETSGSEHGIFYNLEFSPDGTLLVAGCENKSFLIFDPLSRRLIRAVHNSHASCVSRVKFLDSRIFATGFFDGTVSLWDTRNLKTECQTLMGHSKMVTDIELSRKNDSLITVGYDGITCIWDIKNWNEKGEINKDTLKTPPLIRMRLNHQGTKMIFSTVVGYLIIVHDLDLNTFAQDVNEFVKITKEDLYVYKAIARWVSDSGRILTPNRRRNRVEMVADLPNPFDHYTFSTLEIHPQGWSVFSRSVTSSPDRDWICVHDIQDQEPSRSAAAQRRGSRDKIPPCPQRIERIHEERYRGSREIRERSGSPRDTARARSSPPGPSSAPRLPQELTGLGSNPAFSRVQNLSLSRLNLSVAPFNRFPRLTHYTEVPVVRKSCTGSLCVSADGRLVCSPLEGRIRLFAFSPECSEQSVSYGTYPKRLHELSTRTSQTEGVICTKFSPRDCLLVSGCSDGKLVWYQPVV